MKTGKKNLKESSGKTSLPEDFRDQLKQMKQLGSIESIIGMIPD